MSSDLDGIKKAAQAGVNGIKREAVDIARAVKWMVTTKARQRAEKEREHRQQEELQKRQKEAETAETARVEKQRQDARAAEDRQRVLEKLREDVRQEQATHERLHGQLAQSDAAYEAAHQDLHELVQQLDDDLRQAVAADPSAHINPTALEKSLKASSLSPALEDIRGFSGASFSSAVPGTTEAVATPRGTPFATSVLAHSWPDLVGAADQYAVAKRHVERTLDHKGERAGLLDASGLLIHRADDLFATGESTSAWMTLDNARELLDVVMDVGLAIACPELFAVKSMVELMTGHNLVTGAKLSAEQQAFNVLNAVFVGASKGVKTFKQAGQVLSKFAASESAGSHTARTMLGYLELADQAARRERTWVERTRASLLGPEATKIGAIVGVAQDEKMLARVGRLAPHERVTAAYFGGIEGVLAFRDKEVLERVNTWGLSQEGLNQAATHLFSVDRKVTTTMKKLTVVERKAKLEPGVLTRVFKVNVSGGYFDPTQKEIKKAVLALDDAANFIQKYASDIVVQGETKSYWLASDSPDSVTGLILKTYKDQKQTIFPWYLEQWKNFVSSVSAGGHP